MIEEKLSRLTSEQRREVEDFIDFLMSRDGIPKHGDLGGGNRSFSEIGDFPDSAKDTLFCGSHEIPGNSGDDILADYPEYGETGNRQGGNAPDPRRPGNKDINRVQGRPDSKDPSRLLDWLD
ncbi:MAG TPA: hypothetical protein VMC42_09770 [Methanoregulaceae archaeon]|nr:hypothetical protein [Methanoregulaceae archaeon]